MSVVCSVDYEIAAQYAGKNLMTKVEGKKHPVYLKLTCDENDIEKSIALAKGSRNIVMLEYQGRPDSAVYQNIKPSGVYVGVIKDAGSDIDESVLEDLLDDVPTGVTLVVRLPKGYCSLGKLWELTKNYSNVRFCGGLLFAVDGVKVGAVGPDVLEAFNNKLDETTYMVDGTDDCVPDLDILELDINASVVAGKTKVSKPKSSGSSTSKKKPVVSFASLMSDSEVSLP